MSDPATLLLWMGAASFTAALISASLSVGGGYVLFGASTLLFPLPVAIALQPALSYSSLVARTVAFWKDIGWAIVVPFTLGSLVGVSVGLAVYHAIPERALALGVGALMLVLTWAKLPLSHIHSRIGLASVGVAHAISGTVFGLGGVLQPVLLNSGIARQAIVGTFATCLFVLETIRVGGYAMTGFSYFEHWGAILVATIGGFAGTWVGKLLIGHMKEALFRSLLRLLMTGLAARLLWVGLA